MYNYAISQSSTVTKLADTYRADQRYDYASLQVIQENNI